MSYCSLNVFVSFIAISSPSQIAQKPRVASPSGTPAVAHPHSTSDAMLDRARLLPAVVSSRAMAESSFSLDLLTAMIAPAGLTSACGARIFSTSTRLARVVDRVGELTAAMDNLYA